MPVSLDTKPARDHSGPFVLACAGQGATRSYIEYQYLELARGSCEQLAKRLPQMTTDTIRCGGAPAVEPSSVIHIRVAS